MIVDLFCLSYWHKHIYDYLKLLKLVGDPQSSSSSERCVVVILSSRALCRSRDWNLWIQSRKVRNKRVNQHVVVTSEQIYPYRLSTVLLLSVSTRWPASGWGKQGVVRSCNILSEQSYPNKSGGWITERSRHGNKRPSLLLGRNGRCWVDTDGRKKGKLIVLGRSPVTVLN